MFFTTRRCQTSGFMLRRASEVSAELIDCGSNQCAAQPLREKQNKESGHQEGLQDATGALFQPLGEQAGKGWSCILISYACRIHLLWNFREIYCQDQPQTLQVGSLPKEDEFYRASWRKLQLSTLKNSRVGVHNVQFQLDLTNCDWGSQGFLAILLPSSQSSAERTNWMDLLGLLPAVSWDIFVFCKGKAQADCFYNSFNRKNLHYKQCGEKRPGVLKGFF